MQNDSLNYFFKWVFYQIRVITTDFVANITRFAENRSEETAYSIDLSVTDVFIQAKGTTWSCAIGSIAIIYYRLFPICISFQEHYYN